MGTESKQNGNRKPTESHFSQFSQKRYRKQKKERKA